MRSRWLCGLGLLLVGGLLPSCSDDTECSVNEDCPGDQVCRSNNCVPPEETPDGGNLGDTCTLDTDCDPPLVCDRVAKQCRKADDTDGGVPPTDLGPEDQGPQPQDGGPDKIKPRVVSTVPADQSRGVDPTAAIKVVFSEPVREAIVEAGIVLFNSNDPANVADSGSPQLGLGLPVSYDAATLTATIQIPAAQPLRPYTTYKLTVREEIKDTEGNFLEEFPDIFFTTAPDSTAESFYETIAREYAPYIYQEAARDLKKADYITSYDFDGKWNGERKYTAWQQPNAKLNATVYWNVTETKTHYFITYITYHPYDYDQTNVEARLRDNGMSGSQVIVSKERGWLAVETYNGEGFWAFTVEDKAIEPRPANDGGIGEFKKTFEAGWLLEGRHFQSFIPRGTHESCAWGHETGALELRCRQPNAMQFTQSSGVAYAPNLPAAGTTGEDPGRPSNCATQGCADPCPTGQICCAGACRTIPYGFRSLAAELWTRAKEFDTATGQEVIWSSRFTYQEDLSAEQRREIGRPGYGLPFPRFLAGTLDDSMGQPPWAWDDNTDSKVSRGMWFIDPAYAFHRHLKETAGDAWAERATDYCWNVYLGIFARNQEGCSGR